MDLYLTQSIRNKRCNSSFQLNAIKKNKNKKNPNISKVFFEWCLADDPLKDIPIGVCTDTYVIYQSVLEKYESLIWSVWIANFVIHR